MQIKTVTPDDVRFNLTTQMFEALVRIETEGGTCLYPCAVKGAISLPFLAAAHKLTQQAKKRHIACNDLRAVSPVQTLPLAA